MNKFLYALQNGVVPNLNLVNFQIGRSAMINELAELLSITKEGQGIIKFISGDYGSGKTFLLQYLKQIALDQNFIVASIQVNKGLRFNKMEDFYYHVMHNLSIPQSRKVGSNFEEMFDLWIQKVHQSMDRNQAYQVINDVINELNYFNSTFSRAFLTFIRSKVNRNQELANAAASWIKGEKNMPSFLKAKLEVKGDIDQQNSMDFFKAFNRLIRLTGYSGFLILVDELELVMNERIDIRQAAYENIRNLLDTSGAGELDFCMFLMAGTNELFSNQEKGFPMYAALIERVESTNYQEFFNNQKQPIIYLPEIDIEFLLPLTHKILDAYQLTNDWDAKITGEVLRNWTLAHIKKINTPLKGVNIRAYTKKVLEILTILEQNPDYKGFNNHIKLVKNNNQYIIVNELMKGKEYVQS